MATMRDLAAMIDRMPEALKDMEFAIFDSVTGTRVMFEKGKSELRVAYSFGRPLIELQGTQDTAQRKSAPPFPGKV